jgi:hypothetical protein
MIITGDALFSNGPFIKHLKVYGHAFILVAREKDHKALRELLWEPLKLVLLSLTTRLLYTRGKC